MQPLFSSDSHVVEPEEAFAQIDPGFHDRRPQAMNDPEQGALMIVPGLDFQISAGALSRAGIPYEEWARPRPWEEIHPASHDPKARLLIQDEENVVGEVIYPSVGMVICLHPDVAYRKACSEAYNRWLAEFCATDPKRLIGVGMAAIPTPEEGVRELEEIARQGFKSVMLCGDPAFEDYDHPSYDPVWEAAIDLGLPISFHILTGRESYGMEVRGPKVIQQIVTVRGNQNIIMMMVLGGVFARHPDLKVVMVENDAGWLPHFCFRMDHAWERHRWSLEIGSIDRPPSEYVRENVWVTFQDDSSVRHVIDAVNLERVMWASDFPHGDGTYPHSQDVADDVTEGMTEEQKFAVVYGNGTKLYGS
ncbi:MAG: amidohydrolase [Deltaproteobacteria bacterium]|jgi:predicted TIM-barrel fold metal-dependent hydrolase|nr:amidohydrolase [Deltaproteobacteria bacterium]